MTSAHTLSEEFASHLRRIEQQIKDRQLQEAATELNILARSNRNDPRLYLLGSRLAEAAGNFPGMLVAARRANELAPEWPIATIHLAAVLARNGIGEGAVLTAESAIQQATKQSTLTRELLIKAATIARRQQDYAQALNWLQLANQDGPGDIAVQHQIAEIHCLSGQYETDKHFNRMRPSIDPCKNPHST
jgi:tetratricopeptide (TPR) repeat protein